MVQLTQKRSALSALGRWNRMESALQHHERKTSNPSRPFSMEALDEANAKGWTVVSMKADWNKILTFQ